MRRYYIISKDSTDKEHCMDKMSKEVPGLKLVSGADYEDYIKAHGHHFTPALADEATKWMENADGTNHNWTTKQVMDALTSLGLKKPKTVSDGDMAYLANMMYADLFPEVFKDPMVCVKAAEVMSRDVDGYEGMIFNRWLSDAMEKNLDIDWKEYI